ncbi:hypothetical protein CONPUDRAFT_160913 [Coniophora puteana RWD-64-598 SS2]|uniref:DUF6532 domain-containing protein n=1 Tax=Coniophora puteana (strain RWD-64-598) TaxID=741705 RepID=A0A5M3N3S9_CONPW|nr:uncharacterized protein CONPUDRAFT_160913 [Coniophora puteana RWD-64-598 SS2]EIW86023.1 hypothetical protein CONPUDRAFT_160913 [Coniophora puteana RWD-64-598 SS2]
MFFALYKPAMSPYNASTRKAPTSDGLSNRERKTRARQPTERVKAQQMEQAEKEARKNKVKTPTGSSAASKHTAKVNSVFSGNHFPSRDIALPAGRSQKTSRLPMPTAPTRSLIPRATNIPPSRTLPRDVPRNVPNANSNARPTPASSRYHIDDLDDSDDVGDHPSQARSGHTTTHKRRLVVSNDDEAAEPVASGQQSSSPPAQVPAAKRPRPSSTQASASREASSTGDVEEDADGLIKPERSRAEVPGVKVGIRDFVRPVRELFTEAVHAFTARLVTSGVWVDDMTNIEQATAGWEDARVYLKSNIKYTDEIIDLLCKRYSNATNDVKNCTANLVITYYGFMSSDKARIQERNKELVKQLLDRFGMCYRDLGDPEKGIPRTGLYEHPLMQDAINRLWFKNSRDVGIIYGALFEPMPIPAMALVWTGVEHAIKEWETGVKKTIQFDEKVYHPILKKHITNLEETVVKWGARVPRRFHSMVTEHYNLARFHGDPDGVTSNASAPVEHLSESEFDSELQDYLSRTSSEHGGDESDNSDDLQGEGGEGAAVSDVEQGEEGDDDDDEQGEEAGEGDEQEE